MLMPRRRTMNVWAPISLTSASKLAVMPWMVAPMATTTNTTRRQPVPEMPAYAICPVCGHRDAAALAREAGRRQAGAAAPRRAGGGVLRRALRRVRPSVVEYHWIATLYERAAGAR